MGVCDVPVISSVCDAVGEGAASLVSAPFDWLAQAMGAAAGWLFEAVWSVFDTTDPGGCHQARLRRRLQPAVRHRGFRDADLLLPPTHHRPDPPRPHRPHPRRPRAGEVRPRIVRRHHPDGAAAGSRRSAVHRDRAGRRETTESMGDKIALLAAGWSASTSPPRRRRDHHDLHGRPRDHRRRDRLAVLLVRKALLLVAVVFAPLAFSVPRGMPRGVDREVGDVRRRADLLPSSCSS